MPCLGRGGILDGMSDDRSGFEDLFRKLAEEVQRGIERASEDLEGIARATGVDPRRPGAGSMPPASG